MDKTTYNFDPKEGDPYFRHYREMKEKLYPRKEDNTDKKLEKLSDLENNKGGLKCHNTDI